MLKPGLGGGLCVHIVVQEIAVSIITASLSTERPPVGLSVFSAIVDPCPPPDSMHHKRHACSGGTQIHHRGWVTNLPILQTGLGVGLQGLLAAILGHLHWVIHVSHCVSGSRQALCWVLSLMLSRSVLKPSLDQVSTHSFYR